MPMSQWGSETREDREATVAEWQPLHQRLDATIGRVLDEFLAAHQLTGQYTVGMSDNPPAWWLGNPRTRTSERPLHIHLQFDALDRATEPTLAVHIQGAAERFPQNVHTLGHILHRETKYRVRLQGSQGTTEVWPPDTIAPVRSRRVAIWSDGRRGSVHGAADRERIRP